MACKLRYDGGVEVKALLAVVIASTVTLSAARSAGPDPRYVNLAWVVVPAAASATIIDAKPGDILLRQRLIPLGYAALAQDALDQKTGNLVAPASTSLLRLQAAVGVVYCVAADPKHTALARAKPGSPYLRACFRDADADGRFDESAEYDGKVLALPSISGRLPKRMHPLATPVGYVSQSLQSYSSASFVGIRLEGTSLLSGMPVFKDVYGHDDEIDGVNRAWPRQTDGTGPISKTGTVLLDGARITVLENNGSTLKVRIDKPIPAGVFNVTQLRGGSFF